MYNVYLRKFRGEASGVTDLITGGCCCMGCVLQGLLNCKSWVTVRVAGAQKSNRGITFSGRRSIVGGVCCASRCGPVRAALPLCAAFDCLVCGFHRPLGGAVRCGLLVCVSRGWRCAMRIAGVRVAWVAPCHADCWRACRVGGAVPWGLLVCVSGGWRCAMGIAGGRVVWVALYHAGCWCACRVGGAVPWGLLVGVSCGWRCAMRIAGVRVAWVALCHGDCWRACRVGGAVPWGLLVGVSRGWRRVLGIADRAFVSVAPCLGDC